MKQTQNLAEIVNGIINGSEKACGDLDKFIRPTFHKGFMKNSGFLRAVRDLDLETMEMDSYSRFWEILFTGNYAKLSHLVSQDESGKCLLAYVYVAASHMPQKLMHEYFDECSNWVEIREWQPLSEDLPVEDDSTMERVQRMRDCYSRLSKKQRAVMEVVEDNLLSNKKLSSKELGLLLGMTENQFNRNKCAASKKLRTLISSQAA